MSQNCVGRPEPEDHVSDFRKLRHDIAIVSGALPDVEAALQLWPARQACIHVDIDAVVGFGDAVAEVFGVGDEVVEQPEGSVGLELVDAVHAVAAAVRQP